MARTWWLEGSIVLILFLATATSDDFLDLPGPYCAQRNTCCNGRQDNCAVPILGTLCYCDDFCNSTGILHNDCCPDYWSFCRGMPTPVPFSTTTVRPIPDEPEPLVSCTHNGINHPIGRPFWENCNKCQCVTEGNTARIECENNVCLVTDEIINGVNHQHGLTWRAANYSEFWGRTLEDGLQLRLGTLPPAENVKRMQPVIKVYNPASLPPQFDAEQRWPRYIHGIEDQGWCGSSWALSTASVASDRYAIISQGLENVKLSIQNILSCDKRNRKMRETCKGGHLDRAWLYIKKYGVVDEDCFPYRTTFETCKINKRSLLAASGCAAPPNKERIHKYRVGPAYKLRNETDIMYEIMNSGPVQATMRVYHDFFSYGGGIYTPSNLGQYNSYGYHSVKIVGWGEENYRKYWKVANSWGRQWGEDGYFRIGRGRNECDIEMFVLGVWPEIEKDLAYKNA